MAGSSSGNGSTGTAVADFAAQLATAMIAAMDARPKGRSRPEDMYTVTAGIVLNPHEPTNPIETIVEPMFPDPAMPRSRPLSRGEIGRLTRRAPLTKESVGRLNDEVGGDPKTALRLLKSLSDDPTVWGALFELDDDLLDKLRRLDDDFTKRFAALVAKVDVFRDDLTSVTFEIEPPSGAKSRDPHSNPIYLPDAFELSIVSGVGYDHGLGAGSHSSATTSVGVEATLVWKF